MIFLFFCLLLFAKLIRITNSIYRFFIVAILLIGFGFLLQIFSPVGDSLLRYFNSDFTNSFFVAFIRLYLAIPMVELDYSL